MTRTRDIKEAFLDARSICLSKNIQPVTLRCGYLVLAEIHNGFGFDIHNVIGAKVFGMTIKPDLVRLRPNQFAIDAVQPQIETAYLGSIS